ncbi:MAG: prephenate dehydratase [Thermodesulfobacteriota bacterium]
MAKNGKKIEELRNKIDAIDLKILKLLNERTGHVLEVGTTKRKDNTEFYQPDREREIYERLTTENTGPFPDHALKSVFREIISASLSLESPLKVAYLGPPATFTHQACMEQFGLSGEFVPRSEIEEVFDEVERGRTEFGVVPIENTAEGVVSHTLDMFVTSELKICAEVMLEVSLALMNKSGKMKDVDRVSSHPHALAQCDKWLKEKLPKVPVVDAASTAAAAQAASVDPRTAAIASEAAATLYDLRVVEKKVEDQPHNFTRFLVIGKGKEPKKTGRDKTSAMFATKDTPGALYAMLKPFASRGINLTKIESRPLRSKAWEYIFFLDMDGHVSEDPIKEALGELEKLGSFFKLLGSYPKSN